MHFVAVLLYVHDISRLKLIIHKTQCQYLVTILHILHCHLCSLCLLYELFHVGFVSDCNETLTQKLGLTHPQ
jgi:hypothetical protein